MSVSKLSGQTQGTLFGALIRDFLAATLDTVTPVDGGWTCKTGGRIDEFAQYAHLAQIEALVEASPELRIALGGEYVVKPDVVVSRKPLAEEQFAGILDDQDAVATRTHLRAANAPSLPLLHASISCKWTMRSDRAQNARLEALNLIRSRKGRVPVVAVVTAEPLPSRVASLADGTGDFDRIYHVALTELVDAVADYAKTSPRAGDEQRADLERMIQGNRLSDVSDLVLDLAI